MINSDSKLFCRMDGLSVAAREQQRLSVIADLFLLESGSVTVFEEATQTAAHFLEVPICLLSVMELERQRFKSAIGLSRLGLMNELATLRQMPRLESFCTHVVDSHQMLVVPDTLLHPLFAHSILAQQYGIRAYVGIPLITAGGCCIGTLAVMDLEPRQFSVKELEFLQLTARWSMSEFERQQTGTGQPAIAAQPEAGLLPASIATQLKVELLGQLTQELRTPLTSVMGMASVLTREIYGPLTQKQREYIDIIHRSGQYLLSLVNEILELSELRDSTQELNLTSVDIEMLCQQAINTLEQAAQRREQQIRLSVEPGRRVWLLDKDKVRQMLYHLMFSVIQSSTAGSIVRLHVSRRSHMLNVAVWVSHPWLGEGLPYTDLYAQPSLVSAGAATTDTDLLDSYYYQSEFEASYTLDSGSLSAPGDEPLPVGTAGSREETNQNLGMMLCRQLAEMHGGKFTVQGVAAASCRYVIELPQIAGADSSLT